MIEFRWLLKGKPGDRLPKGIYYYGGQSSVPSKIAILQHRDASNGRFYNQEDGWKDVPIVDEEDLIKFNEENKNGD